MMSNSLATRIPESDVSTTVARHSREKSSMTQRMQTQRPSTRLSETKLRLPLPGRQLRSKCREEAEIWVLRYSYWSSCAQSPLPGATFAHRQLFLLVEPIQLLPVHMPALSLEKNVQASVAKAAPLEWQFDKLLRRP